MTLRARVEREPLQGGGVRGRLCLHDDGAPDGWWLDPTVPEPWGEEPAVSDSEPLDRPGPDAPLCSLLTQPPGGMAACGLVEAMVQIADLSEDALVDLTATAQRVSAQVPAPISGVSPMRPGILLSRPPVEVAAASRPCVSFATAPTVPCASSPGFTTRDVAGV